MKRQITLCLLLTVLALCRADGQAKIDIPGGTKLSLGKIYRGEVVDRTLTLKNGGSDTLHIRRVDASCGCTGTMISSQQIPAGTEGTLRISFNSKNFSGPVHKTVTISSDASNTPELVVEFTADIIDEVVFTPQQFWIKDGEVGRTTRLAVKVKNNGASPLTFRSFRTALEGFVLKLPASPLEPGSEVEVGAEFTPKKAVPFLAEGVFLTTTNPHQPEIYLPIYGNVKEFKFE
jgi:Protein of unknown function (DUF1573)